MWRGFDIKQWTGNVSDVYFYFSFLSFMPSQYLNRFCLLLNFLLTYCFTHPFSNLTFTTVTDKHARCFSQTVRATKSHPIRSQRSRKPRRPNCMRFRTFRTILRVLEDQGRC